MISTGTWMVSRLGVDNVDTTYEELDKLNHRLVEETAIADYVLPAME